MTKKILANTSMFTEVFQPQTLLRTGDGWRDGRRPVPSSTTLAGWFSKTSTGVSIVS